jgi:SH3-like domain-containing protein
MAISYEWDCKTCDTYPTKSGKSNVVYNVHWSLTATDGSNTYKDSKGNDVNYSSYMYGTQTVSTDDLSSFKNWSSLTNADVQGWVETALGSDEVTAMKASLDADIAEKVTPTSVTKTISS